MSTAFQRLNDRVTDLETSQYYLLRIVEFTTPEELNRFNPGISIADAKVLLTFASKCYDETMKNK